MASELHLKNNNPITIKDISAKLNVSSVSVHRALSGKDGVSEKLRRKVLQTAEEMGYEINYDIKVKREVLKLAQLMLGLFCCSKTISYQ